MTDDTIVLIAVGVHHGTRDLFSSGRYHHFVPSVVFGQCEDRICGVSGGGAKPDRLRNKPS